jgi:hypothetical protein
MYQRGVIWWTGTELGVTDGDKHLTIHIGTIPTAEVVDMLRYAARVLGQDSAHSDALRDQSDALNERLEDTMPRGRAAIRVLPDVS